ncbi:MAG: type II secretion system protein [Sedimentisphaeraceae bacterium JB056]
MKIKKGFTLIELLVVISIIAILMAIMMPALAKVREQAKRTVCMTSLKQWGVIFSMYTNDNDNKFMNGWVSTDEWKGCWLYALKDDYIDNLDILLCPGIKRYETNNSTASNNGSHGAWSVSGSHIKDTEIVNNVKGSYCINWWITNPPYDTVSGFSTKDHWRRSTVSQASDIPMLADGAFWIARPLATDAPPEQPGQYYQNGNTLGMQRFCVDRHEGRIGMLFMDQSVKPLAIKRLWTLKWNRSFNTRGPLSLDNEDARPDWPDWLKGLPEN